MNNPPPLKGMSVLGTGLCIPDDEIATQWGFEHCGIDASVLAPMIRRRASQATRMAVSALDRACTDADINRDLPVIFVSSVGEMAVTDRLCSAIARAEFPLSPTLFHNSVHNTAAGYWSMSVQSMAPMHAMAALDDGFALGLLEAWSQLASGVPRLLMVCYDETMPAQLLPDYTWHCCAIALVLEPYSDGKGLLSIPYQNNTVAERHALFSSENPAQAGLPLLKAIKNDRPATQSIQISPNSGPWFADWTGTAS